MVRPFFIVGTGRCGSTRLYELLAPHPRIALTNEARIVDLLYLGTRFAALPAFEPADFVVHERVRLHGIVPRAHLETVGRVLVRHAASALVEIYRELFPTKEFAWWGDKLPDPHAAHAVGTLIPTTRYVILLRDPRDVLCSFRAFARKAHVVAENPFLVRPLGLEEFCVHYRSLYAGALQYLHPHLVVHYENLVARPGHELARVLSHLELEPAPESLPTGEELFARHATSPDPASSVARWRRELTHEEVLGIESALGDLMKEFGYARVG